jgi:hypothetical protein
VNETGQQSGQAGGKPAIVLVHGAFADGSSRAFAVAIVDAGRS